MISEEIKLWMKGHEAYTASGKVLKFTGESSVAYYYTIDGKEANCLKSLIGKVAEKWVLGKGINESARCSTRNPAETKAFNDVYPDEFDIERWKAGELAYHIDSYTHQLESLKFKTEFIDGYVSTKGHKISKSKLATKTSVVQKNNWRMKAKITKEEEKLIDDLIWHHHNGNGICPIPWAKGGEFKLRFQDGPDGPFSNADAIEFSWKNNLGRDNIIAYALTNGWHLVKDNKCPEIAKDWKAGEWEFLWGGPERIRVLLTDTNNNNLIDWSCIYAIRYLKAKTQPFKVYDKCPVPFKQKVKRETVFDESTPIKFLINKPIFPIGQNEMVKIAGLTINEIRGEGKVIEVTKDELKNLLK